PWKAPGLPPPNDYAVANIGQAKQLFSFGVDTDGDDLPDLWEKTNIGSTTTINLNNRDNQSPGGGRTYRQAFQHGLNPNVRAVWIDANGLTGGTGTFAEPY